MSGILFFRLKVVAVLLNPSLDLGNFFFFSSFVVIIFLYDEASLWAHETMNEPALFINLKIFVHGEKDFKVLNHF